jgi:hypothetical protein
MFPKYTGRWLFFRRAGLKLNAETQLHEVRNPKKVEKLYSIADKYGLDRKKFQDTCKKQLSYWILLP